MKYLMQLTNRKVFFIFSAGVILTFLAGCASSPVGREDIEISGIGPAHVFDGRAVDGQWAVWGGRIASIDNRPETTELSVVSYPLDRADRPRIDADPGVRFLVVESGFLEPMEFERGRYVTVLGRIDGLAERRVGERIHDHPVLLAEEIHLWPADPQRWGQGSTRFNIGIGVRL